RLIPVYSIRNLCPPLAATSRPSPLRAAPRRYMDPEPAPSAVSRPFSPGGRPLKCYVGNLKPECRMTHLRHIFSPCGPIVNIELKPTIGCGFVEFQDAESCAAAVRQLDGSDILGQKVRVQAQRVGHPIHNRRVVPPGRDADAGDGYRPLTARAESVAVDHTNAAQLASRILDDILRPAPPERLDKPHSPNARTDENLPRRPFQHRGRPQGRNHYRQDGSFASRRDTWIAPREEYNHSAPAYSTSYDTSYRGSWQADPRDLRDLSRDPRDLSRDPRDLPTDPRDLPTDLSRDPRDLPRDPLAYDAFERERYLRYVASHDKPRYSESDLYSADREYERGRLPLDYPDYQPVPRARSRSPGGHGYSLPIITFSPLLDAITEESLTHPFHHPSRQHGLLDSHTILLLTTILLFNMYIQLNHNPTGVSLLLTRCLINILTTQDTDLEDLLIKMTPMVITLSNASPRSSPSTSPSISIFYLVGHILEYLFIDNWYYLLDLGI
ncbi:Polyadenylate-binding protein RBP45, partial [Neolecta irregularis DAH-3]